MLIKWVIFFNFKWMGYAINRNYSTGLQGI